MKRILCSILIEMSVLCVGCGTSPTQEPPQTWNEPPPNSGNKPEENPPKTHEDFLGEQLGFKSWPGKHGPLKPGLRFDPRDYPQLAGYTITEDERHLEGYGDPVTCLRRLRLASGSEKIGIEIEVSQSETDVVQRILLIRMGNTNMHPAIAHPRGERAGIEIGDLNFISRHSEPSKTDSIDFVRNNIRVHISKSSACPLDVVGLAKLLDDQITSKRDFDMERFTSVLPTITLFEPARKTIAPFSETPLNLSVSDPQGLKMTFQFIALRGGVQCNDRAEPARATFLSEYRTGEAKVDVRVINEALLFNSAQTTVTVRKE
jgi:hypothetical protein